MLLTFSVGTGLLTLDGAVLCHAYSGHPPHVNDVRAAVDSEQFRAIGPIPPGEYEIGTARTDKRLGPVAMPLSPGSDMIRSGFYIHGDNALRNQSASHGCIIAPKFARQRIRDCGVTTLKVTL